MAGGITAVSAGEDGIEKLGGGTLGRGAGGGAAAIGGGGGGGGAAAAGAPRRLNAPQLLSPTLVTSTFPDQSPVATLLSTKVCGIGPRGLPPITANRLPRSSSTWISLSAPMLRSPSCRPCSLPRSSLSFSVTGARGTSLVLTLSGSMRK